MKNMLLIVAAILAIATPGYSADMTPKNEAEFLQMMTEHHKDGVKMAEMAHQKGEAKGVKNLAHRITSDQKKEIKKMQSWQKSWYPGEKSEMSMPKMDMSKLEQASGADFDKEFLSMMTEHHQGAVEMSNASMPKLQHQEAKALAKRIVSSQSAEIKQMEKLQSAKK